MWVRYTEFCYSNWVTTEVITSWWDTKTNVEKKWITLSPWNTLNFIWRRSQNHVSSYDWYMWYRIWTTLSYQWYIDINKPTDYKEVKIYDEAWLWTEVSAYTLGRLPDNSRWDWWLWGWAWWLPVEFVEKIQLTGSSDNWQYIGKTYDYPVYVIATAWNTWFNEPQLFVVATWSSSSNNSYPSSWSYSESYGISHGYAYTGSKIYMVKSWWAQNVNYDIYIYKLNLPS